MSKKNELSEIIENPIAWVYMLCQVIFILLLSKQLLLPASVIEFIASVGCSLTFLVQRQDDQQFENQD